MAKHDRKQTRKLFKREMASATKAHSKGGRKPITPETLKNRFSHIIRNTTDVDAIRNYGQCFEKAFFKATGSTSEQFKRILREQLNQIKQLAFPSVENPTTGCFKGLFHKLNKIQK